MASAPEQPASSPPSWWQRTCRVGWKAVSYFWATFLLTLVLPKVVEVLFSDKPLRSLPNLWPILEAIVHHPIWTLLTFLGLLLLTGLFWFGSRERTGSSFLSPDQQSRVDILKALRKAYTDELAASLQGLARIPLRLHEHFGLTHPARLVTWQSRQPERALPAGTSIVDAYDQAGNGLLILGEPGVGKSTLLYDLAQTLLSRAEQHEQDRLPVILNLASWATKRLPLETWLVGELQRRYGIPRPLGQRWEQQGKLLLLLDGLDEVAATARDACIEAINTYNSKRFIPLVVCSRREEYQATSEQFTLQSAVIVQPLTPKQVEDYLANAGGALAAVQTVMDTNPVLQELLTTPFMLSVVVLAYRGKAVKDLPQLGTPEEQQQQIFADYVERVLDRRAKKGDYTPHQTRQWLTWLAQRMQQFSLSEFYLEWLQPTWLATKQGQDPYSWFVGPFFGLGGGLFFGLLFGLFFGLVERGSGMQITKDLRRRPNQGISNSGRNALLLGLFGGLVGGLVFGLAGGLFGGLAGGLVFGLVSGGGAYLQHYLLQFLLWRSGALPWHYVRFLEGATDCILLQWVGGGYRFIHPLFQEHFASGAARDLPVAEPPPTQQP